MIILKTILLSLIIMFFLCSCNKNEDNSVTTVSHSEITYFTTEQTAEQEYTGTAEHLVTSNTFFESDLQADIVADTADALNIITDNLLDSADTNSIRADFSVNEQLNDSMVINSDNYVPIKPDNADSENLIVPDNLIINKEVIDKPDRKDSVSVTADSAPRN